jgi:hypothetical protein
MPQFKSKSNKSKKPNGSKKGDRKKVKYVWVSSKKAIFLVTGEPRESKYSIGIPIIPLHGYYSSKGESYTAKELSDFYVILNLPKDFDIDEWKGKKVVIIGYDQDALCIDKIETDKNESKGKGKKKGKDEDESENRDEDEDEGKDDERDEDERSEDEEGEEG